MTTATKTHRVCPVGHSWSLDNRIRRWFHDPCKILGPYVREEMEVLDLGCGPGFFTLDLAEMVGRMGRVIAVDLQEGMLDKLRAKIKGLDIAGRITLHQCQANQIGLSGTFDFALAFYVVHEVPNQDAFFGELKTLLKPGGQVLIVEPRFHVSNKAFAETLARARAAGFTKVAQPRIFLSKAAVLRPKAIQAP